MMFSTNNRRGVASRQLLSLAICLAAGFCGPAAGAPLSQFATQVAGFQPAPGQYVNSSSLGNPANAVGAPSGVGTNPPMGAPTNYLVSLGAFGGSVTLKFDHTVKDDPNNPFGMDAIVYGNGFWTGNNPLMKMQEPGFIEISKDINGNGVADDPWYRISGHIPPLMTASWQTKEYDKIDTAYAPQTKAHYPNKSSANGLIWYFAYPDHVALSGYQIPGDLAFSYQNPNSNGQEAVWGYADCSPGLKLGDMNADNNIDDTAISATEFYTTVDDPQVTGMSPEAGGGDAFDIAWAVGAPGGFDGFDFIRITTAVDKIDQIYGFGEASTEIDAVADASPNPESIYKIKSYPDGTGARIKDAVVTAIGSGEFYAQDRHYAGIKVKSSEIVSVGDIVNVIGAIYTSDKERYIHMADRNGTAYDAFVRVAQAQGGAAEPVAMPNARLGGAGIGSVTEGVTGGVGVNNIGLLVRTLGAVKSIGTGCFYISDGSLPEGGALKVSPGVLTLQNPRQVIVTGICSCEQDGENIVRVIRPRSQDDIIEIQ
ncbi:MAG: hypothetical protein Q7N50_09560 [Armatimonadota bacterium]|nr:hypothetical protein [Armatimonadota bacterium]